MTLTAPAAPSISPAAPGAVHGRNRITSKALRRVVSAVAAEALGVKAHQIGVDLGDHDGDLTVTATAAVGVPSLVPGQHGHQDPLPTILARAASAQKSIQNRVKTITGSSISEVNLRLTSAYIKEEGRVR
ncbi:hypothetical protein AX769_08300 [Frondihabitans sp. PAMC 28766]|uniref:hypothetical protein n=1 Tax=Frondihabitans sp. PAMC 28766 TaxID=1795630 RepID=UPI00078BECE3|nr:hypothetical protein [Frondihabitans sp. PAMC 28766]AMM20168.1 hypothetical protein AX769_08300 [Frondihabitans sp. PAMC 28766]